MRVPSQNDQMGTHRPRQGKPRRGRTCECGDHVFAPITKGLNVLVSPEDAALLDRSWAAVVDKRGYVTVSRCKTIAANCRKRVVLAREILKAPANQLVDHRNRDSLDNRRPNLRLCSRSQNAQNAKLHADAQIGFKGVTASGSQFRAAIRLNGVRVELGNYPTPEDAHAAYSKAAEMLFGEFARTA